MSIPSAIGIPNEMKLNEVDFSLPSDSRVYDIKVQASNLSSVVGPQVNMATSTTAGTTLTTTPQFNSQTLYFDLPCGQSPSTFLDNRFTTLSFNATMTVNTAVTSSASAYQRSGGYSWFDRMYITAQNGNIIEDFTELGLGMDLMVATQIDSSGRDTLATQYGFFSDNNATTGNFAQGHLWSSLTGSSAVVGCVETHAYSIPLPSAVVGILADKMLNVGRTSKLQIALVTTNDLPISFSAPGTTASAGVVTWTLSNFSLQCRMIDIGPTALRILDEASPDRKGYIHGQTYKTSSTTVPASVSGQISALVGIRGSSVKSLFSRFVDGNVSASGSVNGKYDSKNPMINALNFNIGGAKLPTNPCNPLFSPSQAFRDLQMASGSYNNSQFASSIVPSQYCKLAVGGTASTAGSTLGNTQEQSYTLAQANNALCQFIYGYDTEIIARRSLMSGLNCNSAPVFIEFNITTAPTNAQTIYVHALIDQVLIHDYATGDIQVRM
jgi:hypothetical protein